MMLTLANIYDVPELNIGFHFYLKSDEEHQEAAERTPIRGESQGKKYSQQVNEGYQANVESSSPKSEEKTALTQ